MAKPIAYARGRFAGAGTPGRLAAPGKFQVALWILVLSIGGAVLIDRLWRYQELAEKTVMEATVVNMRSGLRLRIAELMTEDRMAEAGSLLEQNPIGWLGAPPPNYLGEIAEDRAATIPSGHWYFDTTKSLISVFSTGAPGTPGQ